MEHILENQIATDLQLPSLCFIIPPINSITFMSNSTDDEADQHLLREREKLLTFLKVRQMFNLWAQ